MFLHSFFSPLFFLPWLRHLWVKQHPAVLPRALPAGSVVSPCPSLNTLTLPEGCVTLTRRDGIPCCGAHTQIPQTQSYRYISGWTSMHSSGPYWEHRVSWKRVSKCVFPHRAEVPTVYQGRCCDLSIVVLPVIRSLLPLGLSSPHQLVLDALWCGNKHTKLRDTHLLYTQVLRQVCTQEM